MVGPPGRQQRRDDEDHRLDASPGQPEVRAQRWLNPALDSEAIAPVTYRSSGGHPHGARCPGSSASVQSSIHSDHGEVGTVGFRTD